MKTDRRKIDCRPEIAKAVIALLDADVPVEQAKERLRLACGGKMLDIAFDTYIAWKDAGLSTPSEGGAA